MDITNQALNTLTDKDADVMMENLASKAVKELSNEDALLYEYFIASPYIADFDDLNSNEHKVFLGFYSNLTLNLKTFFAASQTANVIYSIGREYNLGDNKISKIGATIRELLVGNIFIKDFPNAISLKLGIDDIKAGEITNKIISQSFGPIIEDVKRIQRSKFPDKIMQLQKEGRPTGLSQTKVESRSEAPRLPERLEKPPMTDIRPSPTPTPPPQQRPLQQVPSTTLGTGQGRPEFKIPDLGPKIEVKPQSKEGGNQVQKSLEDELEKVANIIDLRNKSEN